MVGGGLRSVRIVTKQWYGGVGSTMQNAHCGLRPGGRWGGCGAGLGPTVPVPCLTPRTSAGGQFDCLINRPDADWMGLAFIGYSRENTLTWSTAIGTGCCITIHNTPSLQGGVVSEPM